MEQKLDYGRIGEKATELELLKHGIEVINLNDFRNNYENADLICMNRKTGKSVMIQVKLGKTHNILTGLTSELDGTIPNAKKQHPEYKSTLSETSRDKWEKITDLLY